MTRTHQAVVIGAGVAGLAAAAALAARGVATALVDDGNSGGLVTNVGLLEGGPGVGGQSGADLVNALLGAALEAGADYRMGEIADLVADGALWRLPDHDLAAPGVVLATGARLRQLSAPGVARLMGRGVSQCAFCDGGLYRGRDVHVVGGGDAAFQEALHLAELCGSVDLLIRGDAPRARPHFIEHARAAGNLRIRTGVEVVEAVGAAGLDAIRTRDRATGAEAMQPTAALFVFIGLDPATGVAPAAAARDRTGAFVVDVAMRTSLFGLYAIGAARSGHGGQIADAQADAQAAAAAIVGGGSG